jgi:chorismate mutase / prephenate dehydratase
MSLDDWRSRINDLDKQILSLLNQRAEAALRIGDLKRRQDLPAYVPEREVDVIARVTARNAGPLPDDAVRAVWREILSGCRAVEAPVTIAYLGPPATFTHRAALQQFGASVQYVAGRTIADVFDDVERGRATYGVIPVENSTEGAVNTTLDRLIETELIICAERSLTVTQHLVTQARELGDIKVVVSHPQALAQCRGWLARHLPDVPTQEVTSTAAAAELAAGDVTLAAIASELAAEVYGVPVLHARIEDNAHNATRFLVVGRHRPGPSGRDKTSILFAMRNEPGALYRVLEPFVRLGLNLTKIESRPARHRPWEYVMFVDFEGHRDTPAVAAALADVGNRTLFLKTLGSYPAA